MRLSFSVLWFDDNDDYFDSLDLDLLKEEVSSWGFELKIKMVTTPEEFGNHSPFKQYDLIVVDHKLESYKDGEDFISDIRSNAIYTEVIFYTAGNTSDLWQAIHTKRLEGIFVSSRTDILLKIINVGRQSIQKVLDLENMRGIVMAEVGELDLLLETIIEIGVKSLPEEQQIAIYKRFYKEAIKQNDSKTKGLDIFIENPETATMLSLCDSDKRWQNFNRLWKCHDKLKGRAKIGDYRAEVLRPRNFLAHGRPEPHKDGGYLFHHQGKEFHFDDTTSLDLRLTVFRYKREFSEIIKLLNSDNPQ